MRELILGDYGQYKIREDGKIFTRIKASGCKGMILGEANKKLELSESWVKHHQKSVELKCEKLAIAVDVLEGIRDSRFALTRTAAHEALKKITQ